MELSIVIPARNEAPNVAPLVAEIRAVLDARADYEIVYVDDGSDDGTADAVRGLMVNFPRLKLLRHAASCGQSTAIRSGILGASGLWIATLDADGQNDPADIPRLWAAAQAAANERVLIAGFRQKRRDTLVKRLSSRIANRVRGGMLKDNTPDTGCGLKLFRRELYLALPFFDHNHRFLPALVLHQGGTVISEPVNHRPRQRGVSNYGLFDRLWVGIVDLFGVMWLMRRAKNPVIIAEDANSTAAERRSTAGARA
jgi:glycosyltransferase involved in cell wall biosynthesis